CGRIFMKSRFLTGVTAAAILAAVPAPMPLTQTASAAPQQQGFCRNADPLPRLDPEPQGQQQQRPGDRGSKYSPVPMAAPPPPPAYAVADEADETATVVTGTRVAERSMESASP